MKPAKPSRGTLPETSLQSTPIERLNSSQSSGQNADLNDAKNSFSTHIFLEDFQKFLLKIE